MNHRLRFGLSVIEFYRADGSKASLFYERPSVPDEPVRLEPVDDGEAAWLVVAFILLVLSLGMAIGWQIT